MAPLPSYFDRFLKKIRLQQDLREELQDAHKELSDRLERDAALKPIFVDTFLQGSYKRATIVQPDANDAADVDLVLVTGLDETLHPKPASAMALFEPFLESNYRGKWEPQARSFGIAHGRIKMDLVITSAPSEVVREMLAWKAIRSQMTLDQDIEFRVRRSWVEPHLRTGAPGWLKALHAEGQPLGDWSADPLRIPDRYQERWEATHPIAQIDWTAEKNRLCNEHYLDVVRALKWWRRRHAVPKYPKGYPFEALIGDACPPNIDSVADGIVRTLEVIDERWRDHALARATPYIKDHGVDQNVLARVDGTDFARFHALIGPAARTARAALEAADKFQSVPLWQSLFGPEIPDLPAQEADSQQQGGFSPRTTVGLVGGGRFG